MTGTGVFTSSITGLIAGTTYYVRAYATNSVGTSYGAQVSFTTLNTPTLTTTAASAITNITASSGGTISTDGGAAVTARGVCWSTTASPTTANSKTTDLTGTGAYTSSITGLIAGTTYYVRAYATNSVGTSYGAEGSFKTYAAMDVDGNGYTSVVIGTQTWMVENLKTTKYNDGTDIPNVTDNTAWSALTSGAWCNYENDAANSSKNGKLYNWFAVNDGRKIAPAGWHVATDAEWTTLINDVTANLGTSISVAKALATTTDWTTHSNAGAIGCNLSLNNYSGFSALPAGSRSSVVGNFSGIGVNNVWWTTDVSSTSSAWGYYLLYSNSDMFRNSYSKSFGFPVRCVKDNLPTISSNTVSLITSNTATSGGNITGYGSFAVTSRGVCWSTTASPTIMNSKTTDGTGIGAYTSSITGLTAGTTYYVRAYATNSLGTAYGNEVSFKTLATNSNTISDLDGNVYPTVTIGTQTWMAENLKTTKYNDGTAIPNITDNTSWSALTSGAYCWYNNDIANKSTLGALYNWHAVNTGKLAPAGWHVPTDDEWITLANYVSLNLGASPSKAKALASTIGWNIDAGVGTIGNNLSQNNSTGFNLMPGGYRGGVFEAKNYYAALWTKTRMSTTSSSYYKHLESAGNDVYTDLNSFSSGFSVRCVKNEPPTLTTAATTILTSQSCYSGGDIVLDGFATVTARGTCWSTSPAPTIANSKTIDGAGIGAFTSSITGLTPNTTYYLRAYATNSEGVAYGNELVVKTLATISDIDGNVYNTVTIGTQTWMAENLKTTHYRDGTLIPNTTVGTTWGGLTTGAWCDYDNSVSNGTAYGHLYNWFAASDSRNLAPLGWHVPTNAEWTTLITYLGGVSVAGGKLKQAGTLNWISPNTAATNETGFSALPGGKRYSSSGFFSQLGSYGYWRSFDDSSWSTQYMESTYAGVDRFDFSKADGFSVRCVRDVLPTISTAATSLITTTSATSGGNVIFDGDANVTARGVCWSTIALPTTTNSKTTDGTGTGIFTSSITGLSAGTTYYVRAYATNIVGTSYGPQVSFTTTATLPTLTTTAVSTIAATTATSGGTITADGGATVTSRGVCWSTTALPTIANSKTIDGTGTGAFVSSITGLLAGTTYYLRAYATNSYGTSYGVQISFATTTTLPTLTTTAVSAIVATTATSGGTITADGGAAITARGVCWSTTTSPTTTNSKTTDGTGTGIFTSSITGLTAGTTYYVRAYATNSIGTNYGTETSFKTFAVLDVDGNGYTTVVIGTQTWMVENLKTTKYNDGTAIPNITSTGLWNAANSGGYCFYNNDINNKTANGGLYNWYAVNTAKLAPTGWRVPSSADWDELSLYLGGNNTAGSKLKESGTTNWLSPNLNASNLSGFTALPSGYRGYIAEAGAFCEFNKTALFWSSSSVNLGFASVRYLSYNGEMISDGFNGYNQLGLSVRCLKNQLPTLTTLAASSISTTSASIGGNINSDGGVNIISRGVCWSLNASPTIADNKTSDGTGIGAFTSSITGLTPNTTYYVRAYATNSLGTAYGNEVSFKTYAVMDVDGNGYTSVVIGTQTWMVENLRTTKYRNSENIANTPWSNTNSSLVCDFEDLPANGVKNGHLYNWFAVVDIRNIAPIGWHVPSIAEYTTLINFLGGVSIAGGKLKEVGSLNWASPNTGATNESGFTALPGGMRDSGGSFGTYGSYFKTCNFWSTTETFINMSNIIQVTFDYTNAFITTTSKGNGCSVRCIKDSAPSISSNTISLITSNSATIGGNVEFDGGTAISALGACWSTSPNPTIADSKSTNTGSIGSFSSYISILQPNTTYYVRTYATNSQGTAYGNELSFTTKNLQIGDVYLGGKVAYLDASGIHGFVCAPNDQSTNAPWYASGTTGATNVVLETSGVYGISKSGGRKNTDAIITVAGAGTYAASICAALTIGGASAGDWYLPSKGELNQMFINKSILGGFTISNFYWSSSENGTNTAWSQFFSTGVQDYNYYKTDGAIVRAIRAF